MEHIRAQLPDWANTPWFGLLAIVFIAWLVGKIFGLYVQWVAGKLLSKYKIPLGERQRSLSLPAGIIGFAGFWIVSVRLLKFDEQIVTILLKGGHLLLVVGFIVAVYRVVDLLFLYLYNVAKKTQSKFDDILVPLLNKCAKFLVIALGAIFIGDALNLDMRGIIAGLGIGGLAVALAAKDTLSNLFGSLTVVLDRPFRMGDWVKIDSSIEGTVERVGMRSCGIRTFYDSLITIPNGQIANAQIDNFGARTYRRFTTAISLCYGTPPEKIEEFCEGVRHIITTHQWTRKDYFHVYLNNLGDSAVEVLLYVFWRVPDWSRELEERHRLLLDILRLGERLNVSFAFPTQTVHLVRGSK